MFTLEKRKSFISTIFHYNNTEKEEQNKPKANKRKEQRVAINETKNRKAIEKNR